MALRRYTMVSLRDKKGTLHHSRAHLDTREKIRRTMVPSFGMRAVRCTSAMY
jgi:hypothetical protein